MKPLAERAEWCISVRYGRVAEGNTVTKQTAKPRRSGLQGTNLWHDPRTGIYVWRRTHQLTGKRFRKSTGTKNLRIALARVQQFEEEYERQIAGLSNYGDYRRPLEAFVEPFLEPLTCSDQRVNILRMRLKRAFRLLRLSTLADLDDFMKIECRLLRLEGSGPDRFSRKTLAEGFQSTLKQLSAYLAGRREIPVNHLSAWPRLKNGKPSHRRRALTPEEIAWAFAASDRLDELCGRHFPTRPVWTALLITAPRVSALADLDVAHLDRENSRLLFKGNGNKRAGAGALDETTLAETIEYLDTRIAGPIFLSPQGRRINRCRSLDQWRAAVSPAVVDLEWPDNEVHDIHTEYLVHYALLSGRVQTAMGGPLSGAHQPGPFKRNARKKLRGRITKLADAIRPPWEKRMKGNGRMIDQHCLRMTHRTWSLAAGVPEILIDRQLGHASSAGDAALRAAWSAVGRAHYTDMNFLTLDARRSAEAVREMLDRAEEAFRRSVEAGETALGVAKEAPQVSTG